MVVGRIVGWLLLIIAIVVLVLGVVLAIKAQTIWGITGAVWYQVHSDSLNLSQAVTQRYVLPVLWDPIAITVLNWPLWIAVAVSVIVPAFFGWLLVSVFRRRSGSPA